MGKCKLKLLKEIAVISSSIAKDANLLTTRVSSLKSQNRAKFSQDHVDIPLKFQCLNPSLTWDDVNHLLTTICHDVTFFAPFPTNDIITIPQIFRDEDHVILRFDSLFDLLNRTSTNDNPKTRAADRKLLKNILLRYFPLLLVEHHGSDYVVDLTKFESNATEILNTFIYFLDPSVEDLQITLNHQENKNDSVKLEEKIEENSTKLSIF